MKMFSFCLVLLAFPGVSFAVKVNKSTRLPSNTMCLLMPFNTAAEQNLRDKSIRPVNSVLPISEFGFRFISKDGSVDKNIYESQDALLKSRSDNLSKILSTGDLLSYLREYSASLTEQPDKTYRLSFRVTFYESSKESFITMIDETYIGGRSIPNAGDAMEKYVRTISFNEGHIIAVSDSRSQSMCVLTVLFQPALYGLFSDITFTIKN